MSQLVGQTVWMAVILVSLVGLLPTTAPAFSVTADSQGNRLYLIISHRDVNFPLESISIQVTSSPADVSPVIPVFTPATVPAASGRIGGLTFDVAFGTPLGSLADVVVTVEGIVGGQLVVVSTNVALDVSSSAPVLQGTLGDPTSIPGLILLDTDGDGFPDLQEIAGGSDPFDPTSVPVAVIPTVAPFGLALIALLLLAAASLGLSRLRPAH